MTLCLLHLHPWPRFPPRRHVNGVQASLSMQTENGIFATYSLDWIFDDLLVLQVLQVLPVLLVLLVLLLEC